MLRNLIWLLPVFLITACGDDPKPKPRKMTKEQLEYLSEQMNKWDATKENDEINQYIKAHNYQMTETPSGLRYMLLKKGSGPQAKDGMRAKVTYKIYSLGGTVFYNASADSAKTFTINQDNVESGLHEGIQLMHVGDQMRFILPSHLAHGLTGDQSKIPPLTSVVYEIELLEVK